MPNVIKTPDEIKRKLEKLARMELSGVSREESGKAIGVSVGRLSQIIGTEEYKEVEERIAGEKFQENELINQGWDGIEALGIKRVLEELKNEPEPDFALRAAVVANRAARRGGFKQGGLNGFGGNGIGGAGGGSVKAVIHLNASFINKIESGELEVKEIIEGEGSFGGEKKGTNFLGARAVQDLLVEGYEGDGIDGVDGVGRIGGVNGGERKEIGKVTGKVAGVEEVEEGFEEGFEEAVDKEFGAAGYQVSK